MPSQVRIKPGLLRRLRELRGIPSEEHQARLMGVDRGTLRRIDAGGVPSGAFIAAVHDTFGLSLGEAFECVPRAEALIGAARQAVLPRGAGGSVRDRMFDTRTHAPRSPGTVPGRDRNIGI